MLTAIGAAGVLEVPVLTLMSAPTAAYSVIGTITTAALGAIGIGRLKAR